LTHTFNTVANTNMNCNSTYYPNSYERTHHCRLL
jgi:hypothetical protein